MTKYIVLVEPKDEDERPKDPTITTKVLKYIILDHYEPEEKYEMKILTHNSNQIITSFLNKKNKEDYYERKTKEMIVTKLNCWDCGLEIFVHNLIVFNKKSKGKRRYYHFRCALKKNLVLEKKEMHEDYRKFMLGILI